MSCRDPESRGIASSASSTSSAGSTNGSWAERIRCTSADCVKSLRQAVHLGLNELLHAASSGELQPHCAAGHVEPEVEKRAAARLERNPLGELAEAHFRRLDLISVTI